MARQDFAKNSAPSTPKSSSGSASVAPVIAIIVIAGACFAAGYWLGSGDKQYTSNTTDHDAVEAQLAVKEAKLKMQQVKIETLEALVTEWKNKAGAGAHTKVGELRFYKELPKQSVDPTPVSAKPVVIAARPTTKPDRAIKPLTTPANQIGLRIPHAENRMLYRIQIASFSKQADAESKQQRLLKAGFSAVVQAVDLGDKGVWYRVYAGPFASKSDAEDSQQRIQQQLHVKGLLVRGG